MTIRWLLLRAPSLLEGDEWLGPRERAVQHGLKLRKRRDEWRLGRSTAKRLLSDVTGVADLARIQIIAADDGAPEASLDDAPSGLSVSISHRSGVAACVAAGGARVGCDLEAIEPRTERFIEDFFTDRERKRVRQTSNRHRDRHVALTWSAKESALKVLRAGLRRDTRTVEVDIEDPSAVGGEWQPLVVTVSPESSRMSGWWHEDQDVVLTVVCDDPTSRIAGHDEQR